MSQPKYKTEIITPAMAKDMLKRNPLNRNIRERHLKRLEKSIKDDQWQENGQGILIAKDGTIIDGQHRLTAVVNTKKSIVSLVVRNLSPAVKETIDLGAQRTCADHLKMQGYTGPVFALAAAAGVCLNFKNGVYAEQRQKVSPHEMLHYLKSNRGILKSAQIFSNNLEFMQLLPQSVSIACHYLFSQIHKSRAEGFFYQLMTGEGITKTSPVLKLRNELISMRGNGKRGEINRKVFMWYMTEAFQAFLENKCVDSLPEYKTENKIKMPRK